jgi:hypothetical protein
MEFRTIEKPAEEVASGGKPAPNEVKSDDDKMEHVDRGNFEDSSGSMRREKNSVILY